MKRLLFITGLLLIVVSSCEETGYPKPDKLISEKKMVNILYDIHLYESIHRSKRFTADSLTFTDQDLHFSILEKHGVENTLFVESILYYSNLPKVYERIYKDVVNKLVMLEEEHNKKEAVKIKPDESGL